MRQQNYKKDFNGQNVFVGIDGNTGTCSCFVEKGIELQAEMSVTQFFCKFLHFDLVGKNYFNIFAGGKGILKN